MNVDSYLQSIRRQKTGTQPSGTVTFLFSDVEGSTQLWESHTEAMREALRRHDEILRHSIENARGYIFKTIGDAFCAAFSAAPDAVQAAVDIQTGLRAEHWDLPRPIRVRIALHSGEAEVRDSDYFGPSLNRTARLQSLAFGGQTILTLVTEELVRDSLPKGISLRELGSHRLKDLTRPETVFELRLAGEDEEYPQLRSLDAHLHNLPLEPTPFIGRESDLERLGEELTGGHARLVTLVGPGGIGKTRMALQIAADLIDSFPDGAFVVDLSSIREPTQVPQAILETLQVTQSAASSVADQLAEYLSKRRMILVLDNFEQVIEGGGEVAKLLARCADLKIIVTSREALHIRGEHVFHVPTLGIPTAQGVSSAHVEGLGQYESVRLFIDRACDQDPNFEVTNENAPAIAEICVRLDGLPLAIELAAARIGLLSPDELLGHLSARLMVLTGGPRDLPGRQQTLRRTIDWSFDLLTEEEKSHFACLSFFAGGFTMNACERVCIDEIRDLSDILQLTQSLVDKSFLVMATFKDKDGSSRFHMLETIREYGLEKLTDLGHGERIAHAHAEYFLSIVENVASQMEGPEQKSIFEMIDAEIANIRAAEEYLTDHNRSDDRARILISLGRYWQVRGFFVEGRSQLRSVISNESAISRPLFNRALIWSALLAREQGDYDEAEAHLERAISASKDDKAALGFALHEAGWTAHRKREIEKTRGYFSRCLSVAKETDDELYEWKSHLGEAATHQLLGDHEAARPILEEAQRFFHAHGFPRLEAQAMGNLGYRANARGELAEAVGIFERLVSIYEGIGDVHLQLMTLNNLADTLLQQREYSAAEQCYDNYFVLASRTGNHRFSALALVGRAEALRGLGSLEDALMVADQAVQVVEEAGITTGMEPGYTFEVAAGLHLEAGDVERARELYRHAIATLRDFGDPKLLQRAEKGHQKALERAGPGGETGHRS